MVDKLMKKEVDHKYHLFISNAVALDHMSNILFSLRESFLEHFGPAKDPPYSLRFETVSGIPATLKTSKTQKWFQVSDDCVAFIDCKHGFLPLDDIQNDLVVRVVDTSSNKNVIQTLQLFIKQSCNPDGVFILEKALFRLT